MESNHARIEIVHPHLRTVDRDGDGRHMTVVATAFVPRGRTLYLAEPFVAFRNCTTTIRGVNAFVAFATIQCTMQTFVAKKRRNPMDAVMDSGVMLSLQPRAEHVDDCVKSKNDELENAFASGIDRADALRMFAFKHRLRDNGFYNGDERAMFVYHFGSYFNHSCSANARHSFKRFDSFEHEQMMHVIATQDIAPGDEVTISYDRGHFSHLQDDGERRDAIRTHLRFDCTCVRCARRSSLEDEKS